MIGKRAVYVLHCTTRNVCKLMIDFWDVTQKQVKSFGMTFNGLIKIATSLRCEPVPESAPHMFADVHQRKEVSYLISAIESFQNLSQLLDFKHDFHMFQLPFDFERIQNKVTLQNSVAKKFT